MAKTMEVMAVKSPLGKFLLHLIFALLVCVYVLPLLLVISVSFTNESYVTGPEGGFGLIPRGFTLEAYKIALRNPDTIIRSYFVTFFQAFIGTVGSLLVAGMAGYALSRSNFRYKKRIIAYIFFTMLFNGGMIANYIVNSNLYQLQDTFWIYILPGLSGGAWTVMVFRTFFKGLPEALFEAAKIDGASELRIFFRIVIPLSVPIFATLAFLGFIGKWNDYYTSLLYIRNEKLYTLQYFLQRIFNEIATLETLIKESKIKLAEGVKPPVETVKYAMCIIAAGPMLVLFPFFQKYFRKGIVVGSVKG